MDDNWSIYLTSINTVVVLSNALVTWALFLLVSIDILICFVVIYDVLKKTGKEARRKKNMIRARCVAKIAGRVSSIQDIKYADKDGTAYLLFSIAVPQSRKKEDGTYEDIDPLFFDISAYGAIAESINRNVHAYKDVTGKIGMPICVKAVITQYEKSGTKNHALKVSEVVFMNNPRTTTQKGIVLTSAFIKPEAVVEFGGRVSMTKGLKTKGATQYLQIGIAQERSIKNREGTYEELEPYYWDLVAYGNMAKRLDDYISKYKAQYGSVGLEIAVKANISTDMWEKNGVKHRKFSFKVNEIDYVAMPRTTTPNGTTTESEMQTPPKNKPDASFAEVSEVEEEEDELPFD